MPEKYAPILLFTFKRLDTLQKTLEALKQNYLANESDLFIFSDAGTDKKADEEVNNVRKYLRTITGFKSITIIESTENKGLAKSIITGVSQIIDIHEKVIVLEDDLVTSRNFLSFMNQALEFYDNNTSIISISGYNMTIKAKSNYPFDVYFALRSASWGWATWKNKWIGIDWDVKDFKEFSSNKNSINLFNGMGSDMFGMLKNQQNGLNNSWAIRYCYHQFKHKLYSVYPIVSKTRNIGFGENATHTIQKYNRFDVKLDHSDSNNFKFSSEIILNDDIIKEFKALNGLRNRLKSKIKNFINITNH